MVIALVAGAAAGWCFLGWQRETARRVELAALAAQSEARSDILMRELPIGAARLESGRLRDANSTLHRMLKRNAGALEGMALTDLAHLDDLKELSREPARDEWQGIEGRLLRGDHTTVWSRIWRRETDRGALLLIEDVGAARDLDREIKATRRAMDDLYQAVAAEHLPFEGRLQSLIELGCRRFSLDTGVVARLEAGKLHILGAVSPNDMLRRGDTFDAPGFDTPRTMSLNEPNPNGNNSNSITRNGSVTTRNGKAALSSTLHSPAVNADWRDYPVHSATDTETFLGAPLYVNGQLYGTLYFAGRMGRPEGFTASETQWVKLMAQWAGGEIERRESRVALEAKTRELEAANVRLEAMATHDGLTGVKNRRAFNDQLQTEWARARRYGTPLSLLLMDVDKFKQYNDNFGHPAGDEVLKQVAQILQSAVRSIDFVARYGGEEFVVLLPNTPAAGAMILAERLRAKIEKGEWPHREVTISLGCASLQEDIADAATLTSRADEALYASKEGGRNRVTHYRDVQREAAV